MPRARIAVQGGVLGLVLTLCAGAVSPGQAATAADDVWFAFNAAKGGVVLTAFPNSGTAGTKQTLKSTNGGTVSSYNATLLGMVADFPGFAGGATGPRAVIVVTNTGATDAMAPGSRPFVIGAKIRMDATNEGTQYDDGNNIIQRGMFNEPAQFKLQVDGNRVSCRIKGDKGDASVWSPLKLTAGAWYSTTCSRVVAATGDRVVVSVAPILAGGTLGKATVTTSAATAIGSLKYPLAEPLSVGGKLNPNGTIPAGGCDPFTGLMDDVYLDIG